MKRRTTIRQQKGATTNCNCNNNTNNNIKTYSDTQRITTRQFLFVLWTEIKKKERKIAIDTFNKRTWRRIYMFSIQTHTQSRARVNKRQNDNFNCSLIVLQFATRMKRRKKAKWQNVYTNWDRYRRDDVQKDGFKFNFLIFWRWLFSWECFQSPPLSLSLSLCLSLPLPVFRTFYRANVIFVVISFIQLLFLCRLLLLFLLLFRFFFIRFVVVHFICIRLSWFCLIVANKKMFTVWLSRFIVQLT